jgi:hypothetical protein
VFSQVTFVPVLVLPEGTQSKYAPVELEHPTIALVPLQTPLAVHFVVLVCESTVVGPAT